MVLTEIPQIKKLKPNRFALLIGSILPDVIDKPFVLLGIGTGRYFSHNLLFVLVSFIVIFLSTKRNLRVSLPFLCGLTTHLLLDIPYVPFFYPFISYEWVVIDDVILFWFDALFTNPFVIITEIAGVVSLVFILIKNKLYHRKEIMDYLKGEGLSIQHE